MNDNEPIVLGKVQKGKTGKPLVVVIIFLFIGAALFFLPTIASYFGDYSVVELIKNGQIVDFFINHDYYMNLDKGNEGVTTKKVEENTPVLINDTAVIKYNNFTLNNFELKTNQIKFTITTSNTIDFDKSNYYLVLYQKDKEIEKLKLSSSITNTGNLTLSFSKQLENTVAVTGIVKEITENTPVVNSTTTLAPINTNNLLTCTNATNVIEYTFIESKLTSIKDKYTYTDLNDGNYFSVFEEYTNISTRLKANKAESVVTETSTGFEMVTTIDLSTYEYINNTNENYYPLNTDITNIQNDMGTKGFDCK